MEAESTNERRSIPEAVATSFENDRDANSLLEARTSFVDSVIVNAAESLLDQESAPVVVAATGGYGRRELFPYSDVDLLILVGAEPDVAKIKEPLSIFLRHLWDSKLRIGHSVRTVADCCRIHDGNVALSISLLDLRFLCGDRKLLDVLMRRLPESTQRNATEISRQLIETTYHRHAKFNNTVYHLEPNIKETPGGIRDIHVLRWLLQLSPGQEIYREALEEVEGPGVSATGEVLPSAKEFLFTLRCFLHQRAGRDNNLLTFELQDEAARELPSERTKPEDWMRLYFGHARTIFQASGRALEYAGAHGPSLITQFKDWRSRLSTPEFTVSRERVFLRKPAETLSSPESILQLFTFVGKHGVRISWDTQRRLRAEIPRIAELFREVPPIWSSWRDLLNQPASACAFQDMQESGILAAAIPEWRMIDSLVVRDFYHRYTVDEHTLVAIETIDRLALEHSETPSRFRQLAVEEGNLAVVRTALLLHDIGKGTMPGDHVGGSLDAAKAILNHMGAPATTIQEVLFLIAHHLDLSLVMNGRDLDDPATARYLTSRIGTQEDLRRLTLLTFADISAVNPTAMTPWRREQLWRVYSLGMDQLRHELATDRIHKGIGSDVGYDVPAELSEFLEGFPKRYLRIHSLDQIQHHYELAERSKRDGVAVEIGRDAGAFSMTVLAHDKAGLFAALCGTLASFGMNIVKGEASANDAGCVLDNVRFTDPLRTLELNPAEIKRLEWTVENVVRGSVEVKELLKRRRATPRPSSDALIVPAVSFNNEASETSTLIDFTGEDRPGLLYDLASTISEAGCDIEVIMIDTEAHRAIDVFYVTCQGGKLDAEAQTQLRSEIMRIATPV